MSSAEKELRILEGKKSTLFQRIQRLHDLIKSLNDSTVRNTFLTLYNSVESTRQEFNEVIDRINALTIEIDDKAQINFQPINAFDELYCTVVSAHKKLTQKTIATQQQVAQNEQPVKPKIKLPALELPSFSGDHKEWPVFYQNFKSLIHDNTQLSDADKIHYLSSKLSKKALTLISGIPPLSENYKIIWDTLVDKYQDDRSLATVYLRQIFEFKQLTSESANNLDIFLQNFVSPIEALKQLKIPQLDDFIFVYLALNKLDLETVRDFEMSLDDKTIPKFDKLVEFVKKHSRVLFRSKSKIIKPKVTHSFVVNKSCPSDKVNNPNLQHICAACNKSQDHPLYLCSEFKKLAPVERFNLVKQNKLCVNCLSHIHTVLSCKSLNRCSTCQKRHHSTLHFNRENIVPNGSILSPPINAHIGSTSNAMLASNRNNIDSSLRENSSTPQTVSCANIGNRVSCSVLLSTAKVIAYDDQGYGHEIRVLLDSASQSNFITAKCFQKLNLSKTKIETSVRGIGAFSQPINSCTSIIFSSRFNLQNRYSLTALIVSKITDNLPTLTIPQESVPHLKGSHLADEEFCIPGPIDMLIGAELFPYLIGPGKIIGPPNAPIAIQSELGYIVMGKLENNVASHYNVFCTINDSSLENLISRFWDLEEIPVATHLTEDDEECERFFQDTYSREKSGRYSVALPFKINRQDLGKSRAICIKRFLNLERRLELNPQLKEEYHAFMRDYVLQDHMTRCEDSDEGCYLPHHCVIKPHSTSTRLRVVFDASCKTDNNVSLNDILLAGPKLHADLSSIILRFRLFPYALTADIRQMYRQILVHPEYKVFQKILWRFSANEEIGSWTLNTVTFGVKSAPFLALRVIKQLAEDEKCNYPLAADVANRDFFVDDLVTSVPSREEGILLYTQLTNMFNSGGFELVKWCSNAEEILNSIPAQNRYPQDIEFNSNDCIKILGLQWKSPIDSFTFKVNAPMCNCTKREVLSSLAKIFDPIGLIAPVTVTAKILLKEFWNMKLGWDDLPDNSLPFVKIWKQFQKELPSLSDLKIPRHVSIDHMLAADLIGFADASEKAYGAVLYVRSTTHQEIVVKMLCAKSRVAPQKTLSTPRLELCAAVVLARLTEFVINTFASQFKFRDIFAFSDSTVALQWISSPSSRWKTFVANRVSLIQEKLPPQYWFHVQGTENPADCLSRGLLPCALAKNSLWYSGPKWLTKEFEAWPISKILSTPERCEEEKQTYAVNIATTTDQHPLRKLINYFSSYDKLLRSTVYVWRFIRKIHSTNVNSINASDLENAEELLIKIIQLEHFKQDIIAIKKKLYSSSLLKLNPFLDSKNILRVGGRLCNADLTYDQKYPILLPKHDNFVYLLIDKYHKSNFHTGPGLVLSLLRQKYWIIGGRGLVRHRLRLCNICFKYRPQSTFPPMGNLPLPRVTEGKAFLHTGTDFAGPIYTTMNRRRGARSQKSYICLFICLAVKAIHLELVSDLSTNAFMCALKRFLSRRGPIKVLYSDCGTNYIGASRQLNEIYQFLETNSYKTQMTEELSNRRIDWKFIPPSAPHFGGIWESNIKCVKSHLLKVIGNQILTFEEMSTVLAQIEAILNSRPLSVLSTDPNDLAPLTPAHFLMQQPLQELPIIDSSSEPLNRLNRYQLIDRMVHDFWKRWRIEYLNTLQTRQKWNTPSHPVKIGSIVIIKKDNEPPLRWPIGIIEEIHPGTDGIIRVASVRTATGYYKRPVTKICPLPLQ